MDTEMAWQSFKLHNAQLSKLAQDIQSTGLGSLEDVYLSIIPPLSTSKKLPRADAIIGWARERARPHEQRGHWEEAADEYLSLYRMAKTFQGQGEVLTKATALLVENLRAITDALKLKKAYQFEERDIQELEQLKEKLENELRDGRADILSAMMGLYKEQWRPWEYPLVDLPKNRDFEKEVSKLGSLGMKVSKDYYSEAAKKTSAKDVNVKEKDILDWTPLHYAAATPKGYSSCLPVLLKFRADVKARDMRGRIPLHHACQHDDARTIRSLLREGSDVNTADVDGQTPLHLATIHGNGDMIQSLVEAGASINATDGLGSTPLHHAAYRGSKPLLEHLGQASMKLRDHNGRTALHMAAMAEENSVTEVEELIRYFINSESDKDAKDRTGSTPLHLAVTKGREAVSKCLINSEVDKNAKDGNGNTPLHLAVKNGHEVLVKYLIDMQVDMEEKDKDDNTPLHYAAAMGNKVIVKHLVEAQVDKMTKGNLFRTPLHFAAENGHEAIVKYFVEDVQVNKEAKDLMIRTPLHLACQNGHLGTVRYLIEGAQANKEAFGRSGMPLHYATNNGHKSVIRYLIEDAKVNKEAKSKGYNYTALHLAAFNGFGAIVRYLIEDAHVNKDARNRNDETPLHSAIVQGHEGVALYLIQDAKVNGKLVDRWGATPLHDAASYGHLAIVKSLIEDAQVGVDRTTFQSRNTALHYAAERGHRAVVKYLVEDAQSDKEARNKGGETPYAIAKRKAYLDMAQLLLPKA